MSTEAQWREQVRRDLVASGWPESVARVIARRVGTDDRATARRPTRPNAMAQRASVPATVSLDRAVTHLFGLPQAIVADFKAAGLSTAEAAAPALRTYLSSRDLVASQQALRLQLLAQRIWRK